ncbi:MAG: MarR family transcriptional regulator [Rhodospirillaceae bacterium]|nr:MarR family transcriptional regulator [Rhodospirillaceae bacterium]MXY40749.1 MarR family transcriptional regulator [Rhodospirillaceae bacterium]MYF86971.1 MarR family transcriptional regulator [Rhodospirillaceae bacterium]MYH36693.1 MarR family transcriptional regulator [Rhodospirillaceae bacterium]MYK15731.1 MarR family transcriptional regulator [Rhodospirillaceae bacterium]
MTRSDPGEETIRGLPFRLENSPFYLMARAISKATRGIDAALGATRFSQTQWRVLITLSERGALSIGDLATAIFVESSAVGRAVGRMERDGLVRRERDRDDRRITRVSLSPEGRLRMEELRAVVAAELNRLLDGFSAEDVQTLNAWLARISNSADEIERRCIDSNADDRTA